MNKMGFHVNLIWLYAVVLHIVASLVFGSLGYLGSVLVNLVTFLLVLTVCRQRNLTIRRWCHLSPIPLRQIGVILILTVLLFIIAGYLNGLSLLFTENLMASALKETRTYFWQSVLVYSLLPAIVEEMLFRGCIFRGIPDKKMAIFLSAALFALLHMNFNQMTYAFFVGLFFAAIVAATDNLSVTIVIHLLFNLINLINVAFYDHPVIEGLLHIRIGGYYPFAAGFFDERGQFQWSLLVVGSVLAAFAAGLAVLLISQMEKSERGWRKDGREERKNVEKFLETEGTEETILQGKTGEEKKRRRRKKEKVPFLWVAPWRPDGAFWIGCVICILVATAYELLL